MDECCNYSKRFLNSSAQYKMSPLCFVTLHILKKYYYYYCRCCCCLSNTCLHL